MQPQTASNRDLFEKAYQFSQPDSRLVRLLESGSYTFFNEFTSSEECDSPAEVRMGARKILMFGSNNYLGLTAHPKVKEAAVKAIQRYGTGCSGSRMLNGTLDMHNRLEAELAEFTGREAALLFGTGFQTNQGALSALLGRNDCVLADRQVHASLVEGIQSSQARAFRFRHNDLAHLEALLQQRNHEDARLIVVDGVYSMEGDTADLQALTRLARTYGARLYLDDAHGVGVLGKCGRGTAEHFDIEDQVDILAGTFSKSFASAGGFIAARKDVIDYVKHISRAFIYSASLPPANLATALAALQIIRDEPERRTRLRQIAAHCRYELRRAGFEVYDGFTPIVPVVVENELLVGRFCNELLAEGVYVNAVIPPAVPRSLIRISCMAIHTEKHVARLVEAMLKVAGRLGGAGLEVRPQVSAAAPNGCLTNGAAKH